MISYLPDILSESDHTHVTGIEGKTGEMCCNLPLHFYPCPLPLLDLLPHPGHPGRLQPPEQTEGAEPGPADFSPSDQHLHQPETKLIHAWCEHPQTL